jgi:hypothetical protein
VKVKKPKQYEVISAEGSELYEGVGTSSGRYFGALITDLPSGGIVEGLDFAQSFRLSQGGKKVKALRVRYLDRFDGWVRADTLKEMD